MNPDSTLLSGSGVCDFSIHCHSVDEEGVPALPGHLMARGRIIGALRAERQILTSANGTSCSARHELRSRTSLLIVLRSVRYSQMPRLLQFLREFWPMLLPIINHSTFALLAQRTRFPSSSRSIGFCVIWVCISSSSSLSIWVNQLFFLRILYTAAIRSR